MKHYRFAAFILFFVIVGASLTLFIKSQKKQVLPQELPVVTVAFDWTPNTNHTGMYVALKKDWYKQEGITVKLLPYSSTVSPDILVSTGKADIGISSTEGVVSDGATGNPVVSIAAILAHNTSALVAKKVSGITKPAKFDNKIYGGFGAAYENVVVGTIIKHDGGHGVFKNVILETDAMQALKTNKIDFVWIFMGWDGILAKREGLELNIFPVVDFGIPDYPTPNIITSLQAMKNKKMLIQKFMNATAKGYEYARTNATESAKILIDSVPKGTFADPDFVYESQNYISGRYADSGKRWGIQDTIALQKYLQFMIDEKVALNAEGKPVEKLDLDTLFTNEFFK